MVFLSPQTTAEPVLECTGRGPALPPRSGGGAEPPSLSISNNCINDLHKLTGRHKNVAECIRVETKELCKKWGIDRIGFVTFTFADDEAGHDGDEADRRMHSLETNILRRRYKQGVIVRERGSNSGRIHYHCIMVMPGNIRDGFDFSEVEKASKRRKKGKPYRWKSANPVLRGEWEYWQKVAPAYGFGQVETLPVRSNDEGIAKYVGKYVSKHIAGRKDEDKGKRLVRYFGYKKKGVSTRNILPTFARTTPGAWLWRKKAERFASNMGCKTPEALGHLSAQMKAHQRGEKAQLGAFDKKWAKYFEVAIMAVDLTEGEGITCPTKEHYRAFLLDQRGYFNVQDPERRLILSDPDMDALNAVPDDAIEIVVPAEKRRPAKASLDPVWVVRADEVHPVQCVTPEQRKAAEQHEAETGKALRLHVLSNPAPYRHQFTPQKHSIEGERIEALRQWHRFKLRPDLHATISRLGRRPSAEAISLPVARTP